MPVAIDTGDVFRIRNDGETDLVIPATQTYKAYRIAPGKSAIVPFEVIRVWWGDPRAKPEVYTKFQDSKERGYVNKREEEIRRLGVLYGSYATDVDTLLDPEYPRHSSFYGEKKIVPHPISVQTENGDAIIPACFDRTGDNIFPVVNTSTEDLTDQVAYQNHLEKRLDDIKAELERLRGQSDDAEVDSGGR